MKKLLSLLLALVMVFALAACEKDNPTTQGGEDDPLNRNPGTTQSTPPAGSSSVTGSGNASFEDIMSGSLPTDIIFGNMDEAAKQQIIADAAREGCTVTFDADGTMTVVSPDGFLTIQHPDGSWTYKDSEGGEGQMGGSWPDNEFTQLIPKPDMDIQYAGEEDGEFVVSFAGATLEQIKAYADKLRGAGFTLDEEVEEQAAMGMAFYSFSACSADGYRVELMYTAEISALTIGVAEQPEDPGDSDDPSQPSGANFPAIPFEHETVGAMDNYLAYKSYSATVEQVRAFAQTLRDAGYTLNAEEQNQELMGYVIYSFSAYNAGGYMVSVFFNSGSTTISLTYEGSVPGGSDSQWPAGLPVYQGGKGTDPREDSVAIYATTWEEMLSYIELLKQNGFKFDDFFDSGMTEEQMLSVIQQWCGTNGTIYITVGYGFGDLGLGYGESGTVTIIIYYEKPNAD